MPYFNVRKSEKGFTLIEGLVTVVIVGIMAALATPRFVGWRNNDDVKQAASEMNGAFLEASRISRQKSQDCSVTIEVKTELDSNKEYISIFYSDATKCLLSVRQLPYWVQFKTNITQATLQFTSKGDLDKNIHKKEGTIVLYKQGASLRKCIVINPLAIVRVGNYQGDLSTVSELNCRK